MLILRNSHIFPFLLSITNLSIYWYFSQRQIINCASNIATFLLSCSPVCLQPTGLPCFCFHNVSSVTWAQVEPAASACVCLTRPGISGGWGQPAALWTSSTPSTGLSPRSTGLDAVPRLQQLHRARRPARARLRLRSNHRWSLYRWPTSCGGTRWKRASRGLGRLRSGRFSSSTEVGGASDVQAERWHILPAHTCDFLHRRGLCVASLLASRLRRTCRWHIQNQMWWVSIVTSLSGCPLADVKSHYFCCSFNEFSLRYDVVRDVRSICMLF